MLQGQFSQSSCMGPVQEQIETGPQANACRPLVKTWLRACVYIGRKSSLKSAPCASALVSQLCTSTFVQKIGNADLLMHLAFDWQSECLRASGMTANPQCYRPPSEWLLQELKGCLFKTHPFSDSSFRFSVL